MRRFVYTNATKYDMEGSEFFINHDLFILIVGFFGVAMTRICGSFICLIPNSSNICYRMVSADDGNGEVRGGVV